MRTFESFQNTDLLSFQCVNESRIQTCQNISRFRAKRLHPAVHIKRPDHVVNCILFAASAPIAVHDFVVFPDFEITNVCCFLILAESQGLRFFKS